MALLAAAATTQPKGAAAAFVILVVVLAIAPFFAYPPFVLLVLCFGLFASAFNLLIGYVGLLSLGHALFFGMGAYVCAHAASVWGLPAEAALLLGAAAGALLGAVAGALAIRSTGIYFAMITVALSQMVYFFCVQAPFTHGEDGIQSVPKVSIIPGLDLTRPLALYVYVCVIFLAGFALCRRVVNSPFGEVVKAIRDNETRAISLGYRAPLYKLAAFTISAGLAGLAGALKVIVEGNASLTDVDFSTSGMVVLMTLVGGMGTLFGPLVGALIVIGMQTYLADLGQWASFLENIGQWVTVIEGAVFVVVVLAFRRGVVGELAKLGGWSL
jgi:branched-chain amino acid transport system permease protein